MIFWKTKSKLRRPAGNFPSPGQALTVLFLFLLFLPVLVGPVFSLDYPAPGPDKIGHFWFSFLGTQYLKASGYSISRSGELVFSLAVFKEILDVVNKKYFDGPDLLLDFLGVMAGMIVYFN